MFFRKRLSSQVVDRIIEYSAQNDEQVAEDDLRELARAAALNGDQVVRKHRDRISELRQEPPMPLVNRTYLDM